MQVHTARQSTTITEFAGPQWRPPARPVSPIIPVCLFLLIAASSLAANEVTEWNDIAGRATFGSGLAGNPLFESGAYAITQAPVHDALNAIDRRSEPYAYHPPSTPGASAEAAVATAAHLVLVDQFKRLMVYGYLSQQAMLDVAYAASLAGVPDGEASSAMRSRTPIT